MATITKTVERETGRDFYVITAERREDHHSLSDGFSITFDFYEGSAQKNGLSGKERHRRGKDMDGFGSSTETILRVAPELAPLVTVHLADLDGTPMHAVANGWYFYSGGAREYEEARGDTWANPKGLTDHERGARALNIPPADLPEGLDKDGFVAFAESLRPIWAEQARQARELLESL